MRASERWSRVHARLRVCGSETRLVFVFACGRARAVVRVHACVRACARVGVRMRVRMHARIRVHACLHAHKFVRVHAFVRTHAFAHVHASVRDASVPACACVSACACSCACASVLAPVRRRARARAPPSSALRSPWPHSAHECAPRERASPKSEAGKCTAKRRLVRLAVLQRLAAKMLRVQDLRCERGLRRADPAPQRNPTGFSSSVFVGENSSYSRRTVDKRLILG
eukprot:6174821-Pleurochrysis_carterae.AAC.2